MFAVRIVHSDYIYCHPSAACFNAQFAFRYYKRKDSIFSHNQEIWECLFDYEKVKN